MAVLLVAVVAGWAGLPLGAQTVYLAFGDSITEGVGDDPMAEERGYPPRLQALLRDDGRDAVVENHGLGGERTAEGLSRLDGVLDEGGDVLLLMEGTNDIHARISIETALFNLEAMGEKAEERGLEVAIATLIPRLPDAARDAQNILNQQLAEMIRDAAGRRGWELVDPFEVFETTPDVFDRFYWDNPEDRVGHPNSEGYDRLARVFSDVLTGEDTVPPVTGLTAPAVGSDAVAPDGSVEMDVWDFGAGIDLGTLQLLVDGQPVAAIQTGDVRRARLVYEPDEPFSGTVRLGLRGRDLASPPNRVDREVAFFEVGADGPLAGDVDQDGRVDGTDLVALALGFGSRRGEARYRAAIDLDDDGRVDGEDLAILAENFGRSG